MGGMADNIGKAVASENRNGRKSVGSAGPGVVPYTSTTGTPVPKKNVSGGTPSIGSGTAVARPHSSERLGASYKVKQVFPAQRIEAQATQANGRIIPATHRVGKGFWSQASGL